MTFNVGDKIRLKHYTDDKYLGYIVKIQGEQSRFLVETIGAWGWEKQDSKETIGVPIFAEGTHYYWLAGDDMSLVEPAQSRMAEYFKTLKERTL